GPAAGQLGAASELDHLISHRVSYREAPAIFEMVRAGGPDWLGIVFTYDRPEARAGPAQGSFSAPALLPPPDSRRHRIRKSSSGTPMTVPAAPTELNETAISLTALTRLIVAV